MIKIRQYRIERIDKSQTYYIWGKDADEAFFRIGRHIDPKVVSTQWTGQEKKVSKKAYNQLMDSQMISGKVKLMDSIKIFHIDRDYSKSLEQQKKELNRDYADFQYLFTDGAHGNSKIHFMSTGLRSERKGK